MPESNGSSADPAHDEAMKDQNNGKSPSRWQRVQDSWSKYVGLDLPTYGAIFKMALAPTIALAIYQSDAYAQDFITVGYLVGIITILSVVPSPRMKFLQTMAASIFFSIIGFGITYLAMFTVLKARRNNLSQETYSYDSSASAVAGVWLFVQIWALNVVRAKNMQFALPVIFWAIVANVGLTYAPQYSNMYEEDILTWLLFKAFFTGFAIATGVSLIVFPTNCRQIVFKDLSNMIESLREILKSNLEYTHSLETVDMFANQPTTSGRSKESDSLEANMRSLASIHTKLKGDMAMAKREIAVGKLGPYDIKECVQHLSTIMIAFAGLSSVPRIFQSVSIDRGWDRSLDLSSTDIEHSPNESEKIRIESIQEWHYMMARIRQPRERLTALILDALEHVEITLQFSKKKRSSRAVDEEAQTSGVPGTPGFSECFRDQSQHFLETKEALLRAWAEMHDIELPATFFTDNEPDYAIPGFIQQGYSNKKYHMLRRQLFLFLYIEFCMMNVAHRTLSLVLAVDRLQEKGKLAKTRLIVPGIKQIRKYMTSLVSGNQNQAGNYLDGPTAIVQFGEAFQKHRNPQHLPPVNRLERFGDSVRAVGLFLKSPASGFGLRCAIATLSIALIDYFQDTQDFFTGNRLFWAQVIISIGMSPSSAGQSLRAFILRILGTALALLLAWVAYYIVDGRSPGVIVFVFIFLHCGAYVVVKYPQFFVAGMISQITIILVCGYELQARKIGLEIATSNNQPFYPIYILGPIRLATVSGGLFVAWLFTVIPYPNSEHSQMRKNVGSAFYLLANLYSVTHETVRVRLQEADDGDTFTRQTARKKLEKSRNELLAKCQLLIQTLRTQAGFEKWDLNIGGKFPLQLYNKLIDNLQSILDNMSVISLASLSIAEIRERHGLGASDKLRWLSTLRKLSGEANIASQQITTLLTLLSSAVTNEQPLPPYVTIPEPWAFSEKIDAIDNEFLGIKHIAEPGYASFATIQIGTKCLMDDLRQLKDGVKELVGELDFSVNIVQSRRPSVHPDTEEDEALKKED